MDSKFSSINSELRLLIRIFKVFGFQTINTPKVFTGIITLLLLATVCVYSAFNYKKFLTVNMEPTQVVLEVCFWYSITVKMWVIAVIFMCHNKTMRKLWVKTVNFNEIALQLNLDHDSDWHFNTFLVFSQFFIITIVRLANMNQFSSSLRNVVYFVVQTISQIYEALIKLKYLTLLCVYTNYLRQFNGRLVEENNLRRNLGHLMPLLRNIAKGHQIIMDLAQLLNDIVSPLILTIFLSAFMLYVFGIYNFTSQILFSDYVQEPVVSMYNFVNSTYNILLMMVPANNCMQQVSQILNWNVVV